MISEKPKKTDPIYWLKACMPKDPQLIKLNLANENAVSFYKSDIKINKGNQVHIAAELSLNNWNGNKNLELKIKDIKIN